ncbi:hypothetical protein ADIS_1940 [Lunatimonas lonarensis]|uniref:Uncharacterized protein n=1 Tax=Lunatimonas lonarensis TaxID=1232681 RepID=R7ZU83_9BACT|nr:hypothetical protein ADIS_1940 [Lunatimonas lonarensis]
MFGGSALRNMQALRPGTRYHLQTRLSGDLKRGNPITIYNTPLKWYQRLS